jgi:Tfp pilus assembly protein PilN
MRPVNLIPPDQRRGQNTPMRTGPLPYLLVGGLVAVLAAVALLVTTNSQIAERKAEVKRIEREDAAAKTRAERLAAYVQFQAVHEQRLMTISSLADSRFDWERVMRELSLVLPGDVWLSELNGTASSDSGGEGASGGALRGEVAGPALEIIGCGTGQEAVAGFITALEDIDGVTRVGVEESSLPSQEEGESGDGDSGGCQTRNFIAEFTITVAFDAAPVPPAEGTEGEVPTSVTEGAEGTASETEGEGESEAGSE